MPNMDNTNTITRQSVVSLTYRIVNEKGDVTEQLDTPIEYIHGIENNMFEKVEQALDGKAVGETIEVALPPDDGFGPHLEELTFTEDIENVPPEYRQLGSRPSFKNSDGETKEFVVSKIENGQVTVDGNHLYAGQTVTFFVKIIGVRPATEGELQSGVPVTPASEVLQ